MSRTINCFAHDREERERRFAAGTIDWDVTQTTLAEAFRDHGGRKFRGVAVATEVAENDPSEVWTGDLCNQFCGLFVGKMPVSVADALFGCPRAFGVFLEQFVVVVRFGEDRIDTSEAVYDHSGDVTDIAENPETAPPAMKPEPDGIHCIVRYGKGLDFDTVDGKTATCLELFPRYPGLYPLPHQGAGMSRRIDGEVSLTAEDVEATGMVPVFVSQDDRGKTVRINADFREARAQLTGRKSCINENTGLFVTNQRTVSRTAAS